MNRRATTRDVAREAGVSLATVDRVLNHRPGVRAQTITRVTTAIERLDYRKDPAAEALSREQFYRLIFLIPDAGSIFIRALPGIIREAANGPDATRTHVEIREIPKLDGSRLAQHLDRLSPDEWDGVAVIGTDAPNVRDAIDRTLARGIRVVTLISDVPSSRRQHFVGIDNVAAGRTAASLLGRFIGEPSGMVQVVLGSTLLRDHVERRFGFEQVLRTDFAHLDLAPVIECFEDNARTARELGARLRSEPAIRGVYVIGGGKQGVIAALHGFGPPGLIHTIAHEATPHSRRALTDGYFDAVLQQDPGHEARSAIRVLKCLIDATPIYTEQERIRIDIFLRDNLV